MEAIPYLLGVQEKSETKIRSYVRSALNADIRYDPIVQHGPSLPFLYPRDDIAHLESQPDTLSNSCWEPWLFYARVACNPKVFETFSPGGSRQSSLGASPGGQNESLHNQPQAHQVPPVGNACSG